MAFWLIPALVWLPGSSYVLVSHNQCNVAYNDAKQPTMSSVYHATLTIAQLQTTL